MSLDSWVSFLIGLSDAHWSLHLSAVGWAVAWAR
jgi:hypothetical protein